MSNPGRKGSGKGAPGKSRAGTTPEKSTDKSATTRPMDWDKAISVALLRSLGQTQDAAAEGAGVSERTVCAWEKSAWWPDAQAEAHQRWLSGAVEKAKIAIYDAMEPASGVMINPITGERMLDAEGEPLKAPNDPRVRSDMSRYVADRLISELAPPKQRITHTAHVSPVDLAKLSDEELEIYHSLMEKAAHE